MRQCRESEFRLPFIMIGMNAVFSPTDKAKILWCSSKLMKVLTSYAASIMRVA